MKAVTIEGINQTSALTVFFNKQNLLTGACQVDRSSQTGDATTHYNRIIFMFSHGVQFDISAHCSIIDFEEYRLPILPF